MTLRLNLCVPQDVRAEYWGVSNPPKVRKISSAFLATEPEIEQKKEQISNRFQFYGNKMIMKELFHSRPKSERELDRLYVCILPNPATGIIKIDVERFIRSAIDAPKYEADPNKNWDFIYLPKSSQLIVRLFETKLNKDTQLLNAFSILKLSKHLFEDIEREEGDTWAGFLDEPNSRVVETYLKLLEKRASKPVPPAQTARHQQELPDRENLPLFMPAPAGEVWFTPTKPEKKIEKANCLESEDLSDANNSDGIFRTLSQQAKAKVSSLYRYNLEQAQKDLAEWIKDNTIQAKVDMKRIEMSPQTILIAKVLCYLKLTSQKSIESRSMWFQTKYQRTVPAQWVNELFQAKVSWDAAAISSILAVKTVVDGETEFLKYMESKFEAGNEIGSVFFSLMVQKWTPTSEEIWAEDGLAASFRQFIRLAGLQIPNNSRPSIPVVSFFNKLFADSNIRSQVLHKLVGLTLQNQVPSELSAIKFMLLNVNQSEDYKTFGRLYLNWYFKCIDPTANDDHESTSKKQGGITAAERQDLKLNYSRYVGNLFGKVPAFTDCINSHLEGIWLRILNSDTEVEPQFICLLFQNHSSSKTMLVNSAAVFTRAIFSSTNSGIHKQFLAFFPSLDSQEQFTEINSKLKLSCVDVVSCLEIGLFKPEKLPGDFSLFNLQELRAIYNGERLSEVPRKSQARRDQTQMICQIIKEGPTSEKYCSLIRVLQGMWDLHLSPRQPSNPRWITAATCFGGKSRLQESWLFILASWLDRFVNEECCRDSVKWDFAVSMEKLWDWDGTKGSRGRHFDGKITNILKLFVGEHTSLEEHLHQQLLLYKQLLQDAADVRKATKGISFPNSNIDELLKALNERTNEESTIELNELQSFMQEHQLVELHKKKSLLEYFQKNHEFKIFKDFYDKAQSRANRYVDGSSEVNIFLMDMEFTRASIQESLQKAANSASDYSYDVYMSFGLSKFDLRRDDEADDKKNADFKDQLATELESLGVAPSLIKQLKKTTGIFTSFLKLAQIFYSDSLMRLLSHEWYKKLLATSEVQRLRNVKTYFPAVPMHSQSQNHKPSIPFSEWVRGIPNWKSEIMDKAEAQQLLADNHFMNCQVQAFELLSGDKAISLLSFLAEADDTFFQRVKDECEISYSELVVKTETMKARLAFMVQLNPENTAFSGTAESLLSGLFRLNSTDVDEIDYLKNQLLTLVRLKSKVLGDRKKLASNCLTMCCITFKRKNYRQTFEFELFVDPEFQIPADKALKGEDAKVLRIEKLKQIMEYRVGTKQDLNQTYRLNQSELMFNAGQQGPNNNGPLYYDFEEMQSHFAYFSILYAEMQENIRDRKLMESEKLAKSETEEQEKQLMEMMKNFRDMGVQINNFRSNLCKLYELGLIRDTFYSELVLYLNQGSLMNGKCLVQSTPQDGSEPKLLFMAMDQTSIKDLAKLNASLAELYKDSKASYLDSLKIPDKYGLGYFTGVKTYSLLRQICKRFNENSDPEIQELLKEASNNRDFTFEFEAREKRVELKEMMYECIKVFKKDFLKSKPDFVQISQFSTTGANLVHCQQSSGTALSINPFEIILKVLHRSTKQSTPNLNLSQILFCSEQTSEFDIKAFISRCEFDECKRPFFVLNPEALTAEGLTNMVESVSAMSTRHKSDKFGGYFIILNNGSKNLFPNVECFVDVTKLAATQFANVGQPAGNMTSSVVFTTEPAYLKGYFNSLSTCVLVESKVAGSGKTYWIRDQAQKLKAQDKILELVELSISGEINQLTLSKRITRLREQLSSHEQQIALHIKLDYIDEFYKYKGIIDYLLYGLCIARKIELNSGVTDLQNRIYQIYIEIGNSMAEKINSLDMIHVIKKWDKENESYRAFMSKLVYEIPPFAQVEINYGHHKDPVYFALYKVFSQFQDFKNAQEAKSAHEKLKLQGNKSEAPKEPTWEPVKIPEIRPPGAHFDSMQAAEIVPTHESKKMQLLLKEKFKEVGKENQSFTCFESWCKYLICLVKDFQECELFFSKSSDANSQASTGSINKNSLLAEVLEEVILSADQYMKLHHFKSSEIQRKIIKIYECSDEQQMQLLLDEGKQTLKAEIERRTWNPEKLFIPVFSSNEFVPVLGSESLLDDRLDNSKPDEIDPRSSLKRYISFQKGVFDSQMNAQDKGDQSSYEHAWLAYCLSKIPMNGQMRSFDWVKQKASNFKGKGYAFTQENFIKIVVMLSKAKLKQPIIIMGESGCGKTYLSEFVVKGLLEDSMKIETMYSGYSEKKLVQFITECVTEAEAIRSKGKNLWVFFDEFNTTAIQSVIADLLLDRVYPTPDSQAGLTKDRASYSKIPDNMIFIACCNPFRIKLDKTDDSMIGLVPSNKSSKLSHIVKPIPDRMLSLVMDFGQLSDTDEKHHIQTMVESEKLFRFTWEVAAQEPDHDPFLVLEEDSKEHKPDEKLAKQRLELWTPEKYNPSDIIPGREQTNMNNRLSLLIFKAHSFVREKEERSGVSLRDIKRVTIFFRWFRKRIFQIKQYYDKNVSGFKEVADSFDYWIIRSPKCAEIAASLCSVILCYSLRMNGQRDQIELHKRMHHWALYACGFESISMQNVEETLMLVATAYLHSIKRVIAEDISQNQAFKENFISLLACYANQIPLIIVGAPGTSKTLSTSSFLQALETKSDNVLLKDFYEPNNLYFGGSETSTSTAVETIFLKASIYYRQGCVLKSGEKTSENQATVRLPVVFFDELGLAELSPHNPLKVMHSKLEYNMGKIPFIGISNWKPDQSKVNRMVCLMRPDMTKDDLVNIFKVSLRCLSQVKLSLNERTKSNFRESPLQQHLRPLFECLAETYLAFRSWQKLAGKAKPCYHPYFHGSRDIYGAYNYLFYKIKENQNKLAKSQEDLKQTGLSVGHSEDIIREIQTFMVSTLLYAVRRNLNGEVYIFGDEKHHQALGDYFLRNSSSISDPPNSLNSSVNQIFKSKVNEDFFKKLLPEEEIKSRKLTPSAEVVRVYSNSEFVVRLDDSKKKSKPSKKQNLNGSSDFYALTSSEVFQYILTAWLKEKPQFSSIINQKLSDPPLMSLVVANILDNNCRFMIVRTESSIVDDYFYRMLHNKVASRQNLSTDDRSSDKIVDWRQVKDSENINDLLSEFKTYVSQGYVVVMKNLQSLYGGLYDLFNQKYTLPPTEKEVSAQDSKRCYLYYGEAKTTVTVHPNFKCIILLDSSQEAISTSSSEIEKRFPAPFLNRFEKFFLHFPSLFDNYEQFEAILKIKQKANELCQGKFSRIPGMNIDYIISCAISESTFGTPFSESSKEILDQDRYLESIFKLATSNYLLNSKLPGDLVQMFLKARCSTFTKYVRDLVMYPDTPFKKIILTYSTKASFNQLIQQENMDLPQVELVDPKSEAGTKILDWQSYIDKEKSQANPDEMSGSQGYQRPVVISFANYKDFPLLLQYRRALDARAKNPLWKKPTKVIMLVHLAPADHDQYGFAIRTTQGSEGFIPQGERAKLIESGAINNWGGWECQTIENLTKEMNMHALLAVVSMPIEDCVLRADQVANFNHLPEKEREIATEYLEDLGVQTIQRLFITFMEDMSTMPSVYGEIRVSKIRDMLKDTEAVGKLVFQQIFKQARKALGVKGFLQPTYKAPRDEASTSDVYEDFQAIIQRGFYENCQVQLKIFFSNLNVYTSNLGTTFEGLLEEMTTQKSKLSKNPPDPIKQQKNIFDHIQKKCLYFKHLMKCLEQLEKTLEKDPQDRAEFTRILPRNLRVPIADGYIQMRESYYQAMEKLKESGQPLHNQESLSNLSEEYSKYLMSENIADSPENSTAELFTFETWTILLLKDALRSVKICYEKLSAITKSEKDKPKFEFSAIDHTKFAADAVRILHSKDGEIFSAGVNNAAFGTEQIDFLMALGKTLCKEFKSDDWREDQPLMPHCHSLFSVFIMCKFMPEATKEIIEYSINSKEAMEVFTKIANERLALQGKTKNSSGNYKPHFNLIGFMAIHDFVRAAIFFNQEKNTDESANHYLKKLRGNSKINPTLRNLLIANYELIRHCNPSDQLVRSQAALVDLDFDNFKKDFDCSTTSVYKKYTENVKVATKDIWDLFFSQDTFQNSTGAQRQSLLSTLADMVHSYLLLCKEFDLVKKLFELSLFAQSDFLFLAQKVSSAIVTLLGHFFESSLTISSASLVERIGKHAANSSNYIHKLSQFLESVTTPTDKEPANAGMYRSTFLLVLSDVLYAQAMKQKELPHNREKYGQIFQDKSKLTEYLQTVAKSFGERYSSDSPTSVSLAFLLGVAFLRVVLDNQFAKEFASSDLKFQRGFASAICGEFKAGDCASYLALPARYPMIFLMQKIFQLNGNFTPEQNEQVEVVALFQQLTRVEQDTSKLVIFNPALTAFDNKEVSALMFELEREQTPNPAKVKALLSKTYKNSNKASWYCVGRYIINRALPDPKISNPQDAKPALSLLAKHFTEYSKTVAANSAEFYLANFVVNLCLYEHLNHFQNRPDLPLDDLENSIFMKIVAHTALTAICFPQINYDPSAHIEWLSQKKITQKSLKAPVVDTRLYSQGCDAMMDAYGYMYRQFRLRFGVAKCQCNLMYAIENCGKIVEAGSRCSTPGCSGILGGTSYDIPHPTQQQLTQTTTMDTLLRLRQSGLAFYHPHFASHLVFKNQMVGGSKESNEVVRLSIWVNKYSAPYSSMGAVQFDAQGSQEQRKVAEETMKKEETNFLLKHMLDHVWILANTFYMNSNQRSTFWENCKGYFASDQLDHLVKDSEPEKHIVTHILQDLSRLSKSVGAEGRVTSLHWMKAFLSLGAEMIIEGAAVDPNMKLYLKSDTLTPGAFKSLLAEQEQLNRPTDQDPAIRSKQTANQLVRLTLQFENRMDLFNPPQEYKMLLYLFPAIEYSSDQIRHMIAEQLEDHTREATTYPLAFTIYKQHQEESLLHDFGKIAGSVLEFYKYLDSKLSKRYTYGQCCESTIQSITSQSSVDKTCENLHKEYVNIWRSKVIGKYESKYPTIFSFGFDCQQGLDLKSYLDKTSQDSCKLINFIFLAKNSEYGSLELFLPKAIIQTLINKVHNNVVQQARAKLNLISVEEPPVKSQGNQSKKVANHKKILQSWEKSIPIRSAAQSDLLRLELSSKEDHVLRGNSSVVDFKTFAANYAQIVDNNGIRQVQIDYESLEEDLAQQIIKWNVIRVEEPDFKNFEFKSDQFDRSDANDAERFLKLIERKSDEELPEEVLDKLDKIYNVEQNDKVKRILGLITEICRELRSQCRRTSKYVGESVLVTLAENDDSENLGSRMIADYRNDKLSPEELEDYKFLDELEIRHLPEVYERLQEMLKSNPLEFFQQHGNKPIAAAQRTIITKGFELVKAACEASEECRKIVASWSDSLVETILELICLEEDRMTLTLDGYGPVSQNRDLEEQKLCAWIPGGSAVDLKNMLDTLEELPFNQAYPVYQMIQSCL